MLAREGEGLLTYTRSHLSVHAATERVKQKVVSSFAALAFDVPVTLVLDDRPGYASKVLSTLSRPQPVLLVTANRSKHYLLDVLESEPEGLVASAIPPPRRLAYYLSRVAVGEHFCEGPTPSKSPLTPRERQVLRRTVYGESVDRLAASLGITTYTAGEHLGHIRGKLSVARNAELVLAYFAGDAAGSVKAIRE